MYNKQNYPAIDDDLDLVDEDDIICHNISLMGKKDAEKMLNIFHYDPEWDQHEQDYQEIKREILGEDDDDDDDDNDDQDDSDSNSDSDDENKNDSDNTDSSDSDSDTDSDEDDDEDEDEDVEIADLTNENVMNLRRRIYLTMVSSLTAEEMAHKIMKKFGSHFKNVSHMILEACAHERSYRKQYGLLAERLCKLKTEYMDCFDELFARQYNEIHLLDTNKIRNVSKFFGHLLYSWAIDWTVMEFIKLNERDTNPSKRIFIKILFQELASFMGKELRKVLFDEETYGRAFDGLFPMGKDANPKDTRFSINFFTTIGLGGLTEEMRTFLKQKHKDMIKQQQAAMESSSDDDSDSDSDDDDDSTDTESSKSSGSESSSSDEESDESSNNQRRRPRKRGKERKRKRSSNRGKDRDRDRNRDRDRDEDRDRDRDRERERRSRRREKERRDEDDDDNKRSERKRDRDRKRNRNRDRGRDRSRDSSRDRSRRRKRSRSKSHSRDRSRSRNRSKSRDRSRSRSRGRWGS